MSATLAAAAFGLLIAGLFWLQRDEKAHTSPVLWVPTLWFLLAASRSTTQWLQLAPTSNTPEQLLEGSPIDRAVYSGLLAAGLVILLTRWSQVGRFLRANAAILLFFVYCAVSLLWSDYPEVAFKRWIKAMTDFVMVLVVLTDREPLAAVKRLIGRATFLLIPLSILFIKYYPHLGRAYGRWIGDARYTGVTTNKNTLGAICMLFGLASVWTIIGAYKDRDDPGRTRRIAAHSVIILMVLWLFQMADSMTAFGCFLLGCGVLVATGFRFVIRWPVLVHILVASILIVCVTVLFFGVDPGVLDAMGREATLTDRTLIWALLLSLNTDPWVGTGYEIRGGRIAPYPSMTTNAWVGTGFESFWLGPRLDVIWSAYSWKPNQAHSGYMEIFINLGWIGVGLLAYVLLSGYRAVSGRYRRGVPTGALMLAYFVAGLAFNFTEAAFFRMMAPVWIILLLAITRFPKSHTAETAPPVPDGGQEMAQEPFIIGFQNTT